MTQTRKPKGTPTGGQFAAGRHPEPDGDIAADTTQPSDPWQDDRIQMARLLEEMQAAGLIDLDDPRWDEFYQNTDLERNDVIELLDRAQRTWDDQKQATLTGIPRVGTPAFKALTDERSYAQQAAKATSQEAKDRELRANLAVFDARVRTAYPNAEFARFKPEAGAPMCFELESVADANRRVNGGWDPSTGESVDSECFDQLEQESWFDSSSLSTSNVLRWASDHEPNARRTVERRIGFWQTPHGDKEQ